MVASPGPRKPIPTTAMGMDLSLSRSDSQGIATEYDAALNVLDVIVSRIIRLYIENLKRVNLDGHWKKKANLE